MSRPKTERLQEVPIHAEHGVEEDVRMRAARRVAAYHIGDHTWADLILAAYWNPTQAIADLEAEMGA